MTMLQEQIARKLGVETERVGVVQGSNLIIVSVENLQPSLIDKIINRTELAEWLQDEGISTVRNVRYL